MKKLVKILLLIPAVYLLTIPAYFAHFSYSRPCKGIKITIADSSKYHFVTRKELNNSINNGSGNLVGKPVKEINLADVESNINKYRELKHAEVYMSIDGTLHVYADQRNPIMRIIPGSGGDFYMDSEGVIVRSRNLYTPRLHVIGGNITISQAMLNGVSVLDTSIHKSILKDIYPLVRYINSNDFWSAQIDQIYINQDDEIDLIPRVGNHIVHLGTTDDFEGKLKNLRAFYDKVMPEVGWNKYSVINIAYKDQIVCKKR